MITVNAPSYRRAGGVDVLDYLPYCRIWVAESEVEEYKEMNKGANIISVPDSVQGNVCRVRNHILDKEYERGVDAVCIIDDDLRRVSYFEGMETFDIDSDNFMWFLGKHTVLAIDAGVRLWGINVNSDKKAYREYSPFSFLSYIGAPFSVHVKSDIRYDEGLPLKEDYDLTLQHLNKYRKVLRVNKFHYVVKQGGSGSGQTGGCASYRNLKKEKEQLELLQKKWGSDIVQIDKSNWSDGKEKIDINPIIRAPIRGI